MSMDGIILAICGRWCQKQIILRQSNIFGCKSQISLLHRIYIYISTFITDLPACHLQFATLNFEPLNQESGLLDLDHLCFRGQVWQSKSDPINLPGRCVFKKKTNEKHRRPWSRYHPAIFGRSAHQIIWTKQTFPNDGLPSWPFQ